MNGTPLWASIDRIARLLVSPFLLVARAPLVVGFVFVGVLAALPFVLHSAAEFKSDDFLLIARGVENGPVEGLWRNLSRPFCDTWVIEFYRPLFTWSFCLDGHLFGGDAQLYYYENIGWHVLAVLAGFAVLRRLLGVEAALFATLLFCASPWSANNVSWISGRCTSVASLFLWIGAGLYLKHVDSGREGIPWKVVIVSLVAMFYRETALFMPVLCFLVDVTRRDVGLRKIRNWCIISSPFILYMVCKYFALGTFMGNYERMGDLNSERAKAMTFMRLAGEVGGGVFEFIAPGVGGELPGEHSPWDTLRIVQSVVVGLILALGIGGGAWRRAGFWVFALFLILHAAPLLAVDRAVHAGTAQRWYTVMWSIAALFAVCANRSAMRHVGFLLILGLAAISFDRLDGNLEQYDRSALISREIRQKIEESIHDTVFVYNLKVYDGASAFYAVGLGQSQLPPFTEVGKQAYPILVHNVFKANEPLTQAPTALALAARGEKVSALFVNWDAREVQLVNPMDYQGFIAGFERMKVNEPSALVTDDVASMTIDVDAAGLERIDLYLMTPVAQDKKIRSRNLSYSRGIWHEDGRYTEDITPMLEYATLLPGKANGRCFLWIVGYANVRDPAPARISDVFEIHATTPHENPHR